MDEEQIPQLSEEFLKEIDEFLEDHRRSKEHTYVADLIRFLLPHKGGLSRGLVLHQIERQRRTDGLPIPPTFEEAVQSSYNQNCLDSTVFRERGLPDSEAIFYSPGGSGSGTWAVNMEQGLNRLENIRRALYGETEN